MLSFGKNKRLVSSRQFKAVLDRSLCVRNDLLKLYIAENDRGYPRLGISVGKACGNAVVRNRWKRLFREVFRQNQDRIPAGFDYLFMVSPPRPGLGAVKQPTFERVRISFVSLVNDAVEKIE